MTTQKDFKRLVRGRMQKTGESYTTARASLLRGNGKPQPPSADRREPNVEDHGHDVLAVTNGAAATPSGVQPAEFAKIAGMSDEKVKEKTGCTWESWVFALDYVAAYNWPHSE